MRFKHVSHIAFMKSAGNYSFRNHHAGINGIHADFSWPEFFRQRPRNRVDGALGGVVNYRCRWSQRAGKRTDINDAAAIGD